MLITVLNVQTISIAGSDYDPLLNTIMNVYSTRKKIHITILELMHVIRHDRFFVL
jgi:hypothetical protein